MTDKFSTLLSETVNAPRLSGSKVKTLTESFTSSLDVSHITTFYKLNRSLPQGGQARISSLYVFDALSRGAKEGLKGKKKVEAKRCLDALEAVAESWIEGMTTQNGQIWAEGKDKARKIIDIWRKYEIFPSDTVDQLSSKLNTPMASGSGGGGSTTPTYEPNGPPPISPALPPLELGTGDVNGLDLGDKGKKTGEGNTSLPPDILKLLGLQVQGQQSATSSANGYSSPATGGTGEAELAAILARLPTAKPQSPSLNGPPSGGVSIGGLNIDPAQLAQLANIANKIKSPLKNNMPLPTLPIPPQNNGYPMQSFSNFPPPPAPQYQSGASTTHGQYPPQQGYGHTSPPPPAGHSRNYGKVKPLKNPLAGMPGAGAGAFLPPPQNNGYRQSQDSTASGSGSGSGWGQRDRERGGWNDNNHNNRDRERSRSPERNRARPSDNGYGSRRSNQSSTSNSNHNQSQQSQDRERERQPPPSRPMPVNSPKADLDNFDMSTFNPMDPSSWAVLGEAWKNSNGSEPSQMDLMGWMNEKMMGMGGGGGVGGGSMGGGGGGGGWGGY